MKDLVVAGVLVLGAATFAACEQQPAPVPAMSPVSIEHEPDSFGDAGDESAEGDAPEAGQLVHSSGY